MAEGPKTPMSTRRKARKRALDVLYESDVRGEPILEVLAATVARLAPSPPAHVGSSRPAHLEPSRPAHLAYATVLVEGVAAHLARIDEMIASYAEGWTLDRMPVVDRNLARIAVFELLYQDDVDDAVAISEAIALAGQMSTDDSPGFLNAMLDSIARYTPH